MASLKALHTFALDAQCPQVLTIESVDSLIETVNNTLKTKTLQDVLILGEGSNTVFVDDISHTVLLNKIKGIELVEHDDAFYLTVGAGENWHELVSYCMNHEVGGFENLALIPGTVGAAPIQNIGAYGVEIEKFIEHVEFLDTDAMSLKTLDKQGCQFAYRDSIFKSQAQNKRIITRVFFKLPKYYELCVNYGPLQQLSNPSAKDVFNAVIDIRRSKLPDVKQLGNAGSFFKNPIVNEQHFERIQSKYADIPFFKNDEHQVKIPAAWLIDRLGFKGSTQGQIACHEKQALVLVNLGGGIGDDLLTMASNIKAKVKQEFDIELENEVRLMGKNGLIHI